MRAGEIWVKDTELELHYGGAESAVNSVIVPVGGKVVITKLKKMPKGEDDEMGVEFRAIDNSRFTWLYKKYFLQTFSKFYEGE